MFFEKNRKTIIDVEDNVTLPYDSIIKCPIVKIGFGSRINGKINIRGEEKCTIGRYCAIGYDVRIITTNHKTNYPNLQVSFNRKYGFEDLQDSSKGSVELGNNVWIGDGVTILAGVKIADGSVIGASSLVTKDTTPFSISYGNPAKFAKYRFSEKIRNEILNDPWWFWSEDKILKNKKFFNTNFD